MTGKAYGFFGCDRTVEEIGEELPYIREFTGTPKNVKARFDDYRLEGSESQVGPGYFIHKDQKYELWVDGPGMTNRGAADEAATILNQTYQTDLFNHRDLFHGGITFKENGRQLTRN